MSLKDLLAYSVCRSLFRATRWPALAWLMIVLICPACATVAPVEEVRLFSKAVGVLGAATQPLLDDLASAERLQGQQIAVSKAKPTGIRYKGNCEGITWAKPGFIDGFCVYDAAYFSEIGDPPATYAFRKGLGIIGDYADILLTLAEGRNLEETSAQVQLLGQNIAALASLASGAGAVGAALAGAFGALQPVIMDAARAGNVKEMKRLVLEGAPQITELIGSIRNAAPALFNVIVHQSVVGATSKEGLENKTVAKVHIDRIRAYRIAVSNYVVLLNELERSFEQLVKAFKQPRNAVSLAAVAQRSTELKTHAETWRRVYTILRAGGR